MLRRYVVDCVHVSVDNADDAAGCGRVQLLQPSHPPHVDCRCGDVATVMPLSLRMTDETAGRSDVLATTTRLVFYRHGGPQQSAVDDAAGAASNDRSTTTHFTSTLFIQDHLP